MPNVLSTVVRGSGYPVRTIATAPAWPNVFHKCFAYSIAEGGAAHLNCWPATRGRSIRAYRSAMKWVISSMGRSSGKSCTAYRCAGHHTRGLGYSFRRFVPGHAVTGALGRYLFRIGGPRTGPIQVMLLPL